MGPTTHGVENARPPATRSSSALARLARTGPGRQRHTSASHASARQLGTGSSARQYGMRQRQRPPGPPAPARSASARY